MNYELTIAVGLGDAILISSALHQVKHKYENIYVNVNWPLAKNFKNNEIGYSKFYKDLLTIVFDDPKFIIDDPSKNPPKKDMNGLMKDGIFPVLPRYKDKLTSKTIKQDIEKPYIVLTTKIREFSRTKYESSKQKIFDELNRLSSLYNIVVMGERFVEMNNEYKIHGDQKIYGIYSDIKNCLHKFTDITIPKLGIEAPTIENLKKDCSIMSEAEAVITIGAGGNFCLGLAVAKKIISLRDDEYRFVNSFFKDCNDMYMSKTPDEFVRLLHEKLQ